MLLALALALPVAQAAPPSVAHQGRMLDSAGVPLDGTHDVSVRLYDQAAGGAEVWSQEAEVDFSDGYFALTLDLDADDLVSDDLWLALALDGGPELAPRQLLHSAPFALRARAVTGGVVDASEIRIDGTTVIGADGIVVAGLEATTLDDLACADGELPVHDGLQWGCDTVPAHGHDATDVTSGVLSAQRLPVGTGADDVAAGDHGHTAADVGALPSSGGALTGALTGTDATFSGSVAASDVTVSGSVNASGPVVFGGAGAPCDTDGAVRHADGALALCDDGAWRPLELAPRFQRSLGAWTLPDGSHAASCLAYLEHDAYDGQGWDRYWIDPDGDGGRAPFRVSCDMQTDGGGWMAWSARNGPWWQDGATCADIELFTTGDLEQMAAVTSTEFRVRSDASFRFTEDDSTNNGQVYGVRVDADWSPVSWHFRGFGTNHMHLEFTADRTELLASCSPNHSCGVAPNWPSADGTTGPVILTRVLAQPVCNGATYASGESHRNDTWFRADHYVVLLR